MLTATSLLLTTLVSATLANQPTDASYDLQTDIKYAEAGGIPLLLDLYRPTQIENPPLVIWIHGGAWRSGSKAKMPLKYLLKAGIAIASVDYRLSPVARFPAQIHDCKAAIRFLRSKADNYKIDTNRVAVAGSSAGGHLVALIGVTNNHDQLEGNIGVTTESSSVNAIVDLYGPTNFDTILSQSTPHGLSVRVPALRLLLGDEPTKMPKLAKLASPVNHVDKTDPPLLILHGDQDPQVPINQSHELHSKYKELGLEATFEVVHGAAHGGSEFHDDERRKLITDFLTSQLKY